MRRGGRECSEIVSENEGDDSCSDDGEPTEGNGGKRMKMTEGERLIRCRERNRVHARNTRERKKSLMESLQSRIQLLIDEKMRLHCSQSENTVASILMALAGSHTVDREVKEEELPSIEDGMSSGSSRKHLRNDDDKSTTVMLINKLESDNGISPTMESLKSQVAALLGDDEQRLEIDHELLTKDKSTCSSLELEMIRRERNRMHAKKTRLRKKKMIQEMEAVITKLESEVSEMKEGLMNILPGGGDRGDGSGGDDVARSYSETTTTTALGQIPSQPSSSRNRKRPLEISTSHPTTVVSRKNTMTSTSSSQLSSSSSRSRHSFSSTSCSPLPPTSSDEPMCESVSGLLKMQRSTSILSLTSIGSSANNLHALDLASSVDYSGGIGALLSIGLNNPTRGNHNNGLPSVVKSFPSQSTTQGYPRTSMDTSTHSLLSLETRCQAPSHGEQLSQSVSMSSSSSSTSSYDSKNEGMRESSSVSMDGIMSAYSSSNNSNEHVMTTENNTIDTTGISMSINQTPLALRRLEIAHAHAHAHAHAISTNPNHE